MSSRYAGGKRKSSMTHARRPHYCSCGRVLFGNGGWSSHQRAHINVDALDHQPMYETAWKERFGPRTATP